MEQKKTSAILLEHLLNVIKLIPMYVLILTLMFFLAFLFETRFPKALYVFLFLCTVAAYFIRYYIHQTFLYYVLHLCIGVITPFIFHTPVSIGFSLVYLFILIIYAYYYRASDVVPVALCLDPAIVVACFIAYLLTFKNEDSYYANHFFLFSILYMLCSNLTAFIRHMQDYVGKYKDNDSVSMKVVIKKNVFIVVGLILLLFFIAFICNTRYLQDFLKQVLDFIGGVLKRILSGLFTEPDYVGDSQRSPEPTMIMDLPSVNNTNWLAQFLNTLFTILLDVTFVAITVFALYKFISYLLSYNRKSNVPTAELSEGIEETRTKIKKTDKKKKHSMFHHRTPDEKVRHEYYKTVTNYQKNGYEIDASQTPLERKDDITDKYQDDIGPITETYEKVRYGKADQPRGH